jgi:hypothetical protein
MGGRRARKMGAQRPVNSVGGARGVRRVLGRIARGRARNVNNRDQGPPPPRLSNQGIRIGPTESTPLGAATRPGISPRLVCMLGQREASTKALARYA